MSHFLNSKDLGSITAYGDAVTGGYDGTKESFYGIIIGQGEFVLPINPSVKPDECTMYIADVQGERTPVTVPSYSSGRITYDGQAHTATFDDVDAELMNVGGTLTATNAGTYYAEFTLKDTNTYKWSDGGIWKEQIPWTINKMAGVLTLSDSMVILNDETTTKTITFTASNTVTVEVQDTTLATATVSGNSIVVTMVSGAVGDTKLIVTCAESDNQEGVVKELGVYANFAPIYGAEWSGGSETTWTRTDDAALFAEPVAALGTGSGSSPFDNILPWSGMRIVEDAVAGTLVEIPKYYYKWTYNGSKMKLQISPIQFEGSKCSPMHSDRGDGQGERDVAYVGRYPCSTNYKSETGNVLQASKTRAQFRTSIHALGNDIWLYDFATYWTIRNLMLVEFADWDFNTRIGRTSISAANGATDIMTYHTGVSTSTRDAGTGAAQYRHIEMSLRSEFVDGLTFSSSSIYACKNPSIFKDTTSGYTGVGSRYSTKGYANAKTFTHPTVNGFEYALYIASAGTSGTCTSYYYGGYAVPYTRSGVYIGFEDCTASQYYSSVYSRLMKLPNNS